MKIFDFIFKILPLLGFASPRYLFCVILNGKKIILKIRSIFRYFQQYRETEEYQDEKENFTDWQQ